MKLPPFGKLAEKHSPTTELRIYLGDNPQAWDVARLRNSTGPAVLLPPGEDFNDYRWLVARRDVLLIQLGPYDQVQAFARHLLNQAATVVRLLYGGRLDIFRHKGANT